MSTYEKASDIINCLFSQYDIPKEKIGVVNEWKSTVSSITKYGQLLSDHSRVIDLKNGILIVEVDNSGCIQLLQLRKVYILKGLKMKIPELEIRNVVFKLKNNVQKKEENKIINENHTQMELNEAECIFNNLKNKIM